MQSRVIVNKRNNTVVRTVVQRIQQLPPRFASTVNNDAARIGMGVELMPGTRDQAQTASPHEHQQPEDKSCRGGHLGLSDKNRRAQRQR